MFVSPPVLSAVPTGIMEYDFAPLFLGLVMGVFLCVLALAVAIGVHDAWWSPRGETNTIQPATPASELPDAA